MTRGKRTTQKSLLANADRVGECLIWRGRARIGPYGVAGYQSCTWLVHRLSYFFEYGDTPNVVRHSCDTPLCIEPRHLLDGEHADNVADKVARKRHRFHDRHPLAKLTNSEVLQIRELVADGTMQKDVAVMFGVSKAQISRIILKQRWAVKGN